MRISTVLYRVRRFEGDAIFTSSGAGEVALHSNVAGFSPGVSPGVFDDPVVLVFLCAIAHRHDSVVYVDAASSIEDALQGVDR